ncbi:hypothetical protein HK096_002911 [Nowakowskiella sp. JEL0078]|nr:hypothetical protein HK096_002911 [Nowakowskiella sp. JEL0078]
MLSRHLLSLSRGSFPPANLRLSYRSTPNLSSVCKIPLRFLSSVSEDVPNSSTPPLLKPSEMRSLLSDIQAFQSAEKSTDPIWLNRISLTIAKLDAPLRIAVVGERNVGTSELVNVLLELSSGKSLVSEDHFGSKRSITRIRLYAPDFHNETSSASEFTEVACPSIWLNNHQLEILEIPGLDLADSSPEAKRIVEDTIYSSDIVVIVTDKSRQLTGAWESQFLRDFQKKFSRNTPNLLIAVNGVEPSSLTWPVISNGIQSRLGVSDHNADLTFPVILAQARIAQTKSAAEYEKEWAASGIRDFKNRLVSLATDFNARMMLRVNSVQFVAQNAKNAIVHDQTTKIKDLEAIADKLETNLLKNWVAPRVQKLKVNFEQKDLSAVEDALKHWIESSREYFSKVSALRLFLGTDMLADDLKFKMTEHSLIEAEYRVL